MAEQKIQLISELAEFARKL